MEGPLKTDDAAVGSDEEEEDFADAGSDAGSFDSDFRAQVWDRTIHGCFSSHFIGAFSLAVCGRYAPVCVSRPPAELLTMLPSSKVHAKQAPTSCENSPLSNEEVRCTRVLIGLACDPGWLTLVLMLQVFRMPVVKQEGAARVGAVLHDSTNLA